MSEFIDVIISYTESYPEVRASIDVSKGVVVSAHLYNADLGVGSRVESVADVDKIDWIQIFTEEKSGYIQDFESKAELLKKYDGEPVGDQ